MFVIGLACFCHQIALQGHPCVSKLLLNTQLCTLLFLHRLFLNLLICIMQVFSKLREKRFPREIELKDLIALRIANSRVIDGVNGGHWS